MRLQSLGNPRSSFVNLALRTVTDAAFRAAMSGDLAVRCWSLYSHVMPGTQEEAAERVDAAPRAAINRRTKDIGQPFGGKTSRRIRKCSQYLSRFSSAVEQRFCKPKVGSSILSTGTNVYPRNQRRDNLRTMSAASNPIALP